MSTDGIEAEPETDDVDVDVVDHSDDDLGRGGNADADTTDISDAMGGTTTSGSTDPVPEADKIALDTLIRRAVSMVQDGTVTLNDVQPKPYHGISTSEFRERVQSQLETQTNSNQINTGVAENAEQINWRALWEEFGFDTPDATGQCVISQTQLELAVEVSEQNIAGIFEAHKRDALHAGYLHEETAIADKDKNDHTLVTVGYRLGENA